VASEYREVPLSGAPAAVVACVWEQRVPAGHVQLVVPDGCLDVIAAAGGDLVVAGADTGPRVVALPAGTLMTGVRLRPGAAGAALGVHAAQLRDREVDLADLWGDAARQLGAALAEQGPARRRALLLEAVLSRRPAPDGLVAAAARLLARPRARVATVAAQLGVTERSLHRRTLAAVGYGPKTLARVGRLARLRALPAGDLAGRALAAGYAGQAHMTDEVRRLTGTTPVRFLEDAAPAAP
jgi:AraC-like DNA-binding protein